MAALRGMASSVSSPQLTERVQMSRKGDVTFVRCIEKITELEGKINFEIELLIDLKKEIRAAITIVEDTDERMALKYRYVHNYTWEQIGSELHADFWTLRRWHGAALLHVKLSENPIVI